MKKTVCPYQTSMTSAILLLFLFSVAPALEIPADSSSGQEKSVSYEYLLKNLLGEHVRLTERNGTEHFGVLKGFYQDSLHISEGGRPRSYALSSVERVESSAREGRGAGTLLRTLGTAMGAIIGVWIVVGIIAGGL